ncbi:large conductance mechanosensitive channel protein MscL, partial [Staphylococcus chromogenes]
VKPNEVVEEIEENTVLLTEIRDLLREQNKKS